MDKTFLAIAATHDDELAALGKAPDLYMLEAMFDQLWAEFGRQVLEETLRPGLTDRQTNIVRARFGRIELAKASAFSGKVFGSFPSPHLQAKLTLPGSGHVFAHVPGLVKQLPGIRVNFSQVHRMCQAAAKALPAEQVVPSSPIRRQQQAAQPPFTEWPMARCSSPTRAGRKRNLGACLLPVSLRHPSM